jgi:ketosteroid isomerase-like protein
MSESDVSVIEAVYEAMAAGNFGRLFELVDEDCVLTQDARLPWGGRHVGHDGVATFGLRLRESILSEVTTDAMFTADGDVIQVGRTVGTTVTSGTAFNIAEVHRWTVRDGRVVAAHFSIDTPAMMAALGDTTPTESAEQGSAASANDRQ